MEIWNVHSWHSTLCINSLSVHYAGVYIFTGLDYWTDTFLVFILVMVGLISFRWLQGACGRLLNGEHKQFIKQKQSLKIFLPLLHLHTLRMCSTYKQYSKKVDWQSVVASVYYLTPLLRILREIEPSVYTFRETELYGH